MVLWKKTLNHLSSDVFHQQFQGTWFFPYKAILMYMACNDIESGYLHFDSSPYFVILPILGGWRIHFLFKYFNYILDHYFWRSVPGARVRFGPVWNWEVWNPSPIYSKYSPWNYQFALEKMPFWREHHVQPLLFRCYLNLQGVYSQGFLMFLVGQVLKIDLPPASPLASDIVHAENGGAQPNLSPMHSAFPFRWTKRWSPRSRFHWILKMYLLTWCR